MELLTSISDPTRNLLPYDGQVYYFGPVLPADQANEFMARLADTIAWKHDELVLFGKKIRTKRKVAWYGDRPFAYRYSGATKTALAWTDELGILKHIAERHTGATFNSCLLNLYHDGSEGMSWHSDDEPDLSPQGAIASISLGAARPFAFRHKTSQATVRVLLEHGSLLLMKGTTQQYWKHSLPTARRIQTPRINLTFRSIVE